MSFSTIADRRRRGTLDGLLVLRNPDSAAISATTSEVGRQIYPVKHERFKVVFSIDAYTGYIDNTAEWNIAVEVSASLSSGYVTVATVSPVGTALETEVNLGGDQVADALATAQYIRVTATKTGAAGNLDYAAWIVP